MNVGKRMSAGLVVSGLLLVASLPSHAATFGVRVIDESGKPVSGASVCMRVQEPARGFNLIKDMTLIEGIPGPRCRADSALASAGGKSVPRWSRGPISPASCLPA